MEALYLVPTLIAAALLWQERKLRDEAERAWRLERVGLLNRIQFPDVAKSEQFPEPSGELLHLPLDDDAAHDEYIESLSS